MTPPPLLALVGFMGSGKSTVGEALARDLGLPFVDLDRVLEEEGGLPIRDWFAQRGEADFRAAERKAVAAACAALHGGGVIALGGGAFADPETRALLAGCARTIWLDVPLDLVTRRVPADGLRPLFSEPATVARLFAERASTYARADLRVDASGPIEHVVANIRSALAASPGAEPA